MPLYRTQVRTNYSGDGGPGYNVFHVRTTNGFAGLESAGEALETFYGEVSRFRAASTTTWDGVWQGVGADAGTSIDLPGWVIDGGAIGTRLPDFVSIILNWRTARAGRSGRGRTFLGPLVLTAAGGSGSNGTPSEECRTAVAGAGQNLIESGAGAGDANFGVYSTKLRSLSDLVSCSVPNHFGSLTTRRD